MTLREACSGPLDLSDAQIAIPKNRLSIFRFFTGMKNHGAENVPTHYWEKITSMVFLPYGT